MQEYQYKHGDTPLEGFTIQRAVGRGGFGEVYYAISDSGREVALKCVQGHEEIELRGIRQCMNLKNPHLVSIFDVKYNDQDRPFVIMEYVAGPSLRDLVNECPSGMGPQKAAFFLREIGKGLTYLHDRGIVHRDLKPGNIFYEDGYVKIGDYGLSKAMASSQHSGQTVTVGTVHYMAPEIGKGQYDQSIDVYALGVVLYEMLTGRVPFLGSSPGEVLMKHMATEVDLEGVAEPFATAIRRAMAKDPAERFHTVQELVEAVYGAEHIRDSVSSFELESLSVIAERVAKKVGAAVGGPGSSAEPTITLGPDVPPGEGSSAAWKGQDGWEEFARRTEEWGQRVGQWGERFGHEFAERAKHGYLHWGDVETRAAADPKLDPLNRKQRRFLGGITMLIMAAGTAMVCPRHIAHEESMFLWALLAIIGGVAGIVSTRYRLKLRSESKTLHRLAYGGLACFGLVACTAIVYLMGFGYGRINARIDGTYLAVFVSLFLLNWEVLTSPGRSERVSLGAVIWAGIVGLITASIFGGIVELTAGVLAGIALVVQVSCPFDPRGPKHWRQTLKELRKHFHESREKRHDDRDGANAAAPTPGAPPTPPPVRPVPDRAGVGAATSKEHPTHRAPIGPTVPIEVVSPLFTVIAGFFLTFAFSVGLIVAVDVPVIISAGLPDADLARELDDLFGYRGWPELAGKIGMVITFGSAFMAACFLCVARRKAGVAHISRAVLGSFGILFALVPVLRESLRSIRWDLVAPLITGDQVGPGVEMILDEINLRGTCTAGIILLISIAMLAWPARWQAAGNTGQYAAETKDA